MPITLKGIRLEHVSIERQDSGKHLLKNASYSLISSSDHVLANQAIGGYNDKVIINPSLQTLQLLEQFISSYRKDVTNSLGLEEES